MYLRVCVCLKKKMFTDYAMQLFLCGKRKNREINDVNSIKENEIHLLIIFIMIFES